MEKTNLPGNIKWINALVLLFMAAMVLLAATPWNAWRNTDPNVHGWNLFSYFTILSNFIAAIVYIIAAIAIIRRRQLGGWFRYLRGAAVLYMLITALVYATLLHNSPHVSKAVGFFDWKNFVLHQAEPIFIIIWWLLWPSRQPVSAGKSFYWLVFPVLYLAYSLIRGSLIGWYPYPFFNPEIAGGATGVTLYVIGIAIGFILFGQLVAWISRARANDQTLY
jgi:hypothetical protein